MLDFMIEIVTYDERSSMDSDVIMLCIMMTLFLLRGEGVSEIPLPFIRGRKKRKGRANIRNWIETLVYSFPEGCCGESCTYDPHSRPCFYSAISLTNEHQLATAVNWITL